MPSSKEIDIHNFDNRLESALRRVKESTQISDKNRINILSFKRYIEAKGLSVPRVVHYLNLLKNLAIWLKKDFKKAKRTDIEKLIRKIETKYSSAHTKHNYKVVLKKFYQWLKKCDDGEYPEEVRWVKTTLRNKRNRLPEELLTEEDIKKLVSVATHPRDKALIYVLYDSGCRISEVASLKIKHIRLDELGAQLIVRGKTGHRRVRCWKSHVELTNWLDNHPDKDNPESPLWLKKDGSGAMSYAVINKMFRLLAKKAKIKRAVNPHMFRHARASELAGEVSESILKERFGWTQGSDMAQVYVHLSGKRVDEAVLRADGLEIGDGKQKESVLKIKVCSRCGEKNSGIKNFCGRCAQALDTQTLMDIENKRKVADELMLSLITDPEVQRTLRKKAVKLGLDKKLLEMFVPRNK